MKQRAARIAARTRFGRTQSAPRAIEQIAIVTQATPPRLGVNNGR
ncbi:MAG: hypothetical protein AAFR76_10235 [Planctomycetota bacterium]